MNLETAGYVYFLSQNRWRLSCLKPALLKLCPLFADTYDRVRNQKTAVWNQELGRREIRWSSPCGLAANPFLVFVS
jgi:hypothetical protein